MPPADEVYAALQTAVFPAAGGAAFVFCLFALGGRTLAAVGAGVAVLAGAAWANWLAERLPWVAGSSAWHQLPKAAVLLGAVEAGLVLAWRIWPDRWPVSHGGVQQVLLALVLFVVRGAAAWAATSLTIPAAAAADHRWLAPVVSAMTLATWATLTRSAGGPTVLASAFLAAAAVLVHAHTARFMEVAVILGYALLAVAIASAATKSRATTAVPVGLGFLPGLLLNGRLTTDSQVPLAAFWLVGLAPLGLAVGLVPALQRRRWLGRAVTAVAVLVPLAVAVGLAAANETLPFEEEW